MKYACLDAQNLYIWWYLLKRYQPSLKLKASLPLKSRRLEDEIVLVVAKSFFRGYVSFRQNANLFVGWYSHPGRSTWNIIMEVWKIIFLSKWVMGRFHVNLPGCWYLSFHHLTMACPHRDSRQLTLWKPMHCPWSSTRITWRYASPKIASLTQEIPLKTNMEPKNGGWEDDFPFQLGDMLVPC